MLPNAWRRWLRGLRERTSTRGHRHTTRPRLEVLEDRCLPSTFTVLNTNNGGLGSLRQAILDANAHANSANPGGVPDRIEFNIPTNDARHFYYRNDGVAGKATLANVAATTAADDTAIADIDPDWSHSWWSILVSAAPGTTTPVVPIVTQPVVIDGYTQGAGTAQAAHANTQANSDNAVLRVELNGSGVPSLNTDFHVSGLEITAGQSTVRGLVINNFAAGVNAYAYGVGLRDHGGNVVAGNFIGTDPSSTIAQPNFAVGLYASGCDGNTLGGTDPGDRNLLSGNHGDNLRLADSSNNVVQGNFIGTDATGTKALSLGGANGIIITGGNANDLFNGPANGNLIGGTAPGAGNVIAGNGLSGIHLDGGFGSVSGTNIQGNFVGTNATGTGLLGNATDGISLNAFVHVGYPIGDVINNTIGGTTPAARNIVSGNGAVYSGSGINIGLGGIVDSGNPFSVCQHNLVEGNYIGTDVTGTVALGNRDDGVRFNAGNTTIVANLVSGNGGRGITIGQNLGDGAPHFGDDSIIQGNFVGTDVTGTKARPNAGGILIMHATNVTVGGTTAPPAALGGAGAGNLISGNSSDGLNLYDWGINNWVQNNFIGTDVSGTANLGNGGNGLGLNFVANAGSAPLSTGNVVGGPGTGNLIAFNGGAGISGDTNFLAPLNATIDSNTIHHNGGRGIILGGPWGHPHERITRNSIYANGGIGIDLQSYYDTGNYSYLTPQQGNPYGVTPNDRVGHNDGPNYFQNFPVLTSAVTSGNSTTITGTLDSLASGPFTIEFFSNDAADSSGYGEGQTYLWSTTVTTGNGHASFTVTFPVSTAGKAITATASDAAGNTSEFSQRRHVFAPLPTATTVTSNQNPAPVGQPVTFTATVAPSGSIQHLLVADFSGHNVRRYDMNGSFEGVFASGGGLINPVGLTQGPDGNLYVADLGTSNILRYDGTSGAFLGVFAAVASGTHPIWPTFGPDGNLYVSVRHSSGFDTVERFKGSTGASLGTFAILDVSNGTFALLFGADGKLYVSEGARLERYNGSTGAFVDTIVTAGTGGLGSFLGGFAFGPDGNVYITDYVNNRVARVNGTTGAILGFTTAFGTINSDRAYADLFGPDGNLYVSSANHSLVSFNAATGGIVDTFVADSSLTAATGLIFVATPPPSVTGTVHFVDTTTGTDLGTLPLGGGSAGVTTSALGLATHTISATYSGDSNFSGSSGSISETIATDPTATALNAPAVTYNANGTVAVTVSSAYGTPTGSVSLSVDGGSALTAALANGSTTFTLVSPSAGNHSLIVTYAAQGNFAGNSATGTLHVNRADLYVTANANSKTYGQTASDSGTLSGVLNNDGITASFSSAGDAATASVAGSPYTISAALADPNGKLGNYTVHETDARLTVKPAGLYVTATANSKTYGAAASDSGTLSGVVNNDGITATFGSAGDAAGASVGSYTISASLADPNNKLSNYSVHESEASLTVKPADLYVTATDNSKSYGTTASDTGTLSGVLNNDGIAASFTSAGDAAGASVGSYTISASLADPNSKLGNYTVHEADASLTVMPADLYVTATANSKTYGATASDTGTIRRVLNNDGITSSFASAGDGAGASVGSYTISATLADPNSKLGNYTVHETDASLTVTLADLYVTATANSKTYGATASDSGTVTGVLNNDGITASFASAGDGAAASVGSYTISATLADPNGKLGNYSVHETDASLAVNPADLYVTAVANSKPYGATASDSGTVTGLLNNDGITATFASAGDGAGASVGSYTISVTLADPSSKLDNYTVHETNGT